MTSHIRHLGALVIALLLLPVAALAAEPDEEPAPEIEAKLGRAADPAREHRQDAINVKLVAGASPSSLGEGARRVFDDWYSVPVAEGESPTQALVRAATLSEVEIVELDFVRRLDVPPAQVLTGGLGTAAVPNDEFFDLQWHMPAADAPDAWDVTSGAGAVVAVVDTGVHPGGEDLDCHTFVDEFNAITGLSGPGSAADDQGHGTHVAGTATQCTGNTVGVAGVAGGATLMPIKVLNASGTGNDSDIAEGVDWARTHGADVVNMSLAGPCVGASILDDALEAAAAAGVVLVAAAGNGADAPGYSGGVSYPACHPDVIAVGATDFSNGRTAYSQWGPSLDLVAPGGDVTVDQSGDGFGDGVLQETFTGVPTNPANWDYWFFEGTSMASPHVAGAAALIRAIEPSATPAQVKQALQASALDLGPAGWDDEHGQGLLQVRAALDAIGSIGSDLTAPSWPAGAQLTAAGVSGNSVDLDWSAATDNIAVTTYRIYRDGALVAETAGTEYEVDGLAEGTTYTFSVEAGDAAGNFSNDGPSVMVTTEDSTPPAFPAGASLTVPDVFEDEVTFTWTAASDGAGISEYRVWVGSESHSTTTTSLTVVGLDAATTYAAWVEAEDAAGNSTIGPNTTFTTAVDFVDTNGSIFERDIAWLAGAGVTLGCNPPDNDQYCPDGDVTRGQMAAFLVRGLGLTDDGGGDLFVDDDTSVFASDIDKLGAAGITLGCNPPDNDRYCPGLIVTRAEMAAFLHRALSNL